MQYNTIKFWMCWSTQYKFFFFNIRTWYLGKIMLDRKSFSFVDMTPSLS